MADAVFDVQWPIMRIVLPAEMSVGEVDTFCGVIAHHYERQRGWVQVVDMNAVQPLRVPPTIRKHFAKTSDALDRRFPEGTRAQAICTESVLVRGVFTAYSWLKLQQTFEIAAFASAEAADPWVQKWADVLRERYGIAARLGAQVRARRTS